MKNKKTGYVKYIILAIALAFIVIGIMNGETHTVLTKAANICLECIGIG